MNLLDIKLSHKSQTWKSLYSIYIKYKNRQNWCALLEVRREVYHWEVNDWSTKDFGVRA
jgi:hypothetical protein